MPLLTQDRQLLDAFRRNEPAALARVYRHYAPGLLAQVRAGLHIQAGERLIRAELGGLFEAETVVQETFARAFGEKARAAYDGLRPYGAFLVGIARNVMLDEYRRQQRSLARFVPLEHTDRGESAPVAAEPGPLAALEVSEERVLVAAFLASCSEDELAVYRARYEEDLSQEAAAARLNVSRMRLRWIERKLRKRLLRFAKQRGFLGEHSDRWKGPIGSHVITVFW